MPPKELDRIRLLGLSIEEAALQGDLVEVNALLDARGACIREAEAAGFTLTQEEFESLAIIDARVENHLRRAQRELADRLRQQARAMRSAETYARAA